MFVCLMLGISEGNAFPGRQTPPVLIFSTSGWKKIYNTPLTQCVAVYYKRMVFQVLSWWFALQSQPCATLASARAKTDKRKMHFIFHLLFAASLRQCLGAPRAPVTDASLLFQRNEMCCAFVPGCAQASVTGCGEPASPLARLDLAGPRNAVKYKPAYLVTGSWAWPEMEVLRGCWAPLTASHSRTLTVVTSICMALGCSSGSEWNAVDHSEVCIPKRIKWGIFFFFFCACAHVQTHKPQMYLCKIIYRKIQCKNISLQMYAFSIYDLC